MSDGNSLINLGDLTKPATVLIEKVSEAVGGYFKPYQIRRVGKAEAEVEMIKAHAQMEVDELKYRALNRFINEEAKKQKNIESITEEAIPLLGEGATPEEIDDDWMVNFFDKCRIISDTEMQTLWSKVLAGESNTPGAYSKKTVNLLASLDKTDAELFASLCKFTWVLPRAGTKPLIYTYTDSVYTEQNIGFEPLTHLDSIGLIQFHNLGFHQKRFERKEIIKYQNYVFQLEFKEDNNKFETGHVLLTQAGRQLLTVCALEPEEKFIDYCVKKWMEQGIVVSSLFPQFVD